ncbi:hypothetical protein V490_08972 [Pseudogymnoascus sp. VKM F-3557]|nr:hypothetical protein V490_08972 [Pseudogymnoascus sp. VKM F-3557]
MLAIAQPILYHYYSTGNVVGNLEPMMSYERTIDDKLPAFLCAIIRHPFLANNVRSLQLQETYYPEHATFAPELLPIFNRTSETYGITIPTSSQWVIDPTLPGPIGGWKPAYRAVIHLWLRELAIVLTPRAEKLMYGQKPLLPDRHIYSPDRHIYSPDLLLPALKTLAFRNGVKNFSMSIMPPLLMKAPNVTSLHVSDVLLHGGEQEVQEPISMVLPKVRKLVVEGLGIKEFSMMVRWCESQSLRDVEFYYHTNFFGRTMVDALAPLKEVLRRFSYVHINGRPNFAIISRAGYHRKKEKPPQMTIESLQEFCCLEELVIDHFAYSAHYVDEKRLVTLLPASIQVLHFKYVYKSIRAELLQFALAVPHNFPKLRLLKIGIASDFKPEHRDGLEDMHSVEADFADVGVQMEWGMDRGYAPTWMTAEPPTPLSFVSLPVASPPGDTSAAIETENPTTRRGWGKVTPRLRKGISSFRSNYLPG